MISTGGLVLFPNSVYRFEAILSSLLDATKLPASVLRVMMTSLFLTHFKTGALWYQQVTARNKHFTCSYALHIWQQKSVPEVGAAVITRKSLFLEANKNKSNPKLCWPVVILNTRITGFM